MQRKTVQARRKVTPKKTKVSPVTINATGRPPLSDAILREIFSLIKNAGGVDFNRYKSPSIRRRIAFRMGLQRIDSPGEYLNRLQSDPGEVAALYENLLITVTEFFRDPDVFERLKTTVIPVVLDGLPENRPARVWVPGCASGEEAYSIAMCFIEVAGETRPHPVQIFATDVSEPCIAKARRGFYPKDIAVSVSPDRLERFFTAEADGFRVKRSLRSLCVFARQDVVHDAPFGKMDLVSCRNLLIYLDRTAQRDVLYRLHYALNPSGFLLLGTAESVSAVPGLFEIVCESEKIYSKKPVATGFRLNPASGRDAWSSNPA